MEYLGKLPDTAGRPLFLSIQCWRQGFRPHAVSVLKTPCLRAEIQLMVLVAAPEGVAELHRAHPDVAIYAAALDRCLDENAYIVPASAMLEIVSSGRLACLITCLFLARRTPKT